MLRVAICDDSGKFLSHIHEMIEDEFRAQAEDEIQINDYSLGELLLIHHGTEPYDVIFLDIDMPNMTGFDLAAKVQDVNKRCCVIFVSSHSELVFDSFYFQPLNFIIKDNDDAMRESLRNVIKQLLKKLRQERKILLKTVKHRHVSVYLNDIAYIESIKHDIIYRMTDSQSVQVHESIGDAEKRYAELDFIRIHKKYLANLKNVFNIDRKNCAVVFKQGIVLKAGRGYITAAEERLTEYLRSN